MFALGLLGIVALGISTARQLAANPPATDLSLPVLVGLSLLTPTVLLVVMVALGVKLAPRVGLRSHIHSRVVSGDRIWPALRSDVRIAVAIGIIVFILLAVLDVLFSPFIPDAVGGVITEAQSFVALAWSLPLRLLYGGITEELLLRWGVMSVIAWLLWAVVRRSGRGENQDQPSATVMWMAIVAAAILFGIGHLPAVAQVASLTPALVGRTILLNAIAGVGFGWLFWRRSLEAAMMAHATYHVVLVGISGAVLLISTVAFGGI